jgi:surface antigen
MRTYSAVLALLVASCTSTGGGYNAAYPYSPPQSRYWNDTYPGPYTYSDDAYYRECRNESDPAGVIGGALIGGLLGNRLGGRGNRTGPTVAGVVVGGLAGAALTSNLNCDDRSYAYRSYYQGLNSGRPGSRYTWRNPRSGHSGDFYVRDYYNDRYGHRCADYSQTIWVNGRRQEATGRACRQPNGTWAIVS